MKVFEKILNSAIVGQRLNEMKEQLEDVKKSKLTPEQKQNALKSHKNMRITTIIFVIFICLIMGIFLWYGFSLGTKGVIIIIISMIAAMACIIIYALLLKKLFPNWYLSYDLVDKGFDGVSGEQVDVLKPNDKENKLIKKYKIREALAGIVFLIALSIEFFIIIKIGLSVYHPVTIVLTLIITIIWYVIQDSYRTEKHRLESGYYKRSFGYICQNCKTEFKIDFKDIDKYKTMEKDKNGIITVNCPTCGSPILLYTFNTELKDYQNYMDALR